MVPDYGFKREDCTGLAFGGNKERKTEFTFGEALQRKADVILTTGPVQSNHARATAAAARRLGLKAFLLLTGEEPPMCDGNLLLDTLPNAEIRFLHGPSSKLNCFHYMEQTAGDLQKEGHIPYVIPAGASYPPGAIAYANAMLELYQQVKDVGIKVGYIVHGAGSGGTQAGLVLALRSLELPIKVLGICAEPHSQSELVEITLEIARSTARVLDLEIDLKADDVSLSDLSAGKAYDQPPSEAVKAIKLVAETEGHLLDPIYTGRAMAGLLKLIRQGYFKQDDNVVFIHTGGTPALFPYRSYFRTARE